MQHTELPVLNQIEAEAEHAQLLPPVTLSPFQKLVDVPEVAERSRRPLCVLAIFSIVLISLVLGLFATAFMINSAANPKSPAVNIMVILVDTPFMISTFVLVLVVNIVSLHNMNKWSSTDVCCNLLRSKPACCTKSCGDSSNKHCCASLACAHLGTAILTFGFLVAFIITFACQYAESSDSESPSYNNYYYNANYYYVRQTRQRRNYYTGVPLSVLAMFEIPAIILLLFLIATTARSAIVLRAIEKEQPKRPLLPRGKMVEEDGNMMQGNVVMAVQAPVVHAVDMPPVVAADDQTPVVADDDDQTQINAMTAV